MTGQKKSHKPADTATAVASTSGSGPGPARRAKAKPIAPEPSTPAPSLAEVGQERRKAARGISSVSDTASRDEAGRPEADRDIGSVGTPSALPSESGRARGVPAASKGLPASAPAPEGDGQPPQPRRGRREQKRAIETKQAILGAALQEFARKGFDAASIRDIADRLGIQHPLITYHYKTKEVLWQAVAAQIVSEVRDDMDSQTRDLENVRPLDRVRAEFRALLHVQHKYPYFHHFMLNESREKGPRLRWLAQNVLAPMVNQNLPEIRRAQADGDLPAGEPVLLHYMLIGMTSALVSLSAEIEAVTGYSIDSPGIEEIYFGLIDQVMFKRQFAGADQDQPLEADVPGAATATDRTDD